MTSLSQTRSPAPVKLAIFGFTYTVRPIDPGECGTVAFELYKADTGHHYHVIRDHFGIVACDCPDYLFRREGTGQPCKHGAALVAKGLVPAPSPEPTTLGPRVFLTPAVSVVENATPRRLDRPRPFEPTPEEQAEAAQMFADLALVGAL